MQLNPLEQRHRRLWLLLGWGMVFSVVVLSLVPMDSVLGEGQDKIEHFIAYGSMTFWFAMLFQGLTRQLGIALAFAAMGVGIEFLQGLTDYRTFDVADMVANALGAGLGWSLAQTPLRNAVDWVERLLAGLRKP